MVDNKNFFRAIASNKFLDAYKVDKNPKHIAQAWLECRKNKAVLDESVFLLIDLLAKLVIDPTAAKVRPKKNTVRDIYILGEVFATKNKLANLRGKKRDSDISAEALETLKLSATAIVARNNGLKEGAVKMIGSRHKAAGKSDYFKPRAFRSKK